MRSAKRWSASLATAAFLMAACGSSNDPNGPSDGGTDGAGGDGGMCCPPDPAPACCMKYGGYSGSGGCMLACDGMPVPGDPGWHLEKDAHGCTMWVNATTRPAHICGESLLRDSGADAGDASIDAGDD